MQHTIGLILQAIVGLGLLNVWLLRRQSATAYRGGEAKNLKDEFAAYGLPAPMFYIVGGLKIVCGVLLLVGLAYPPVVLPAAAVVAVLMMGAVAMHLKVGDPVSKFVPAALMLAMSGAICVISRM
ncbi:MAG: DoxX family protein [Planctomycetota bacterium]|nr:DoxX family protein [Planctomycetota bacterium]